MLFCLVWSAFGSSKVYADSTSYSSVCSALKMHFWSFQAIRASQWQHKNLIKILFCLQNVCAQPALCWRCIFKRDDLHTDGIHQVTLICLRPTCIALLLHITLLHYITIHHNTSYCILLHHITLLIHTLTTSLPTHLSLLQMHYGCFQGLRAPDEIL